LCGYSPFFSTSQQGLFEKIIRADFSFPDPEWTKISEEAKDFIRHLLVKDPSQRFNAEQCLQHAWLNGKCGTEDHLGGGTISSKLAGYNEQRKASFINTGSPTMSQKDI
jgi:calcium/calmodulin-dependent protein kinase I